MSDPEKFALEGWPLATAIVGGITAIAIWFSLMTISSDNRQVALGTPAQIVVHLQSTPRGAEIFAVPKYIWEDRNEVKEHAEPFNLDEYRVGRHTDTVAILNAMVYVLVFRYQGQDKIVHADVHQQAVNIYEARFGVEPTETPLEEVPDLVIPGVSGS